MDHAFRGLSFKLAGEHLARRLVSGPRTEPSPVPALAPAPAPMSLTGPKAASLVIPTDVARASPSAPAPEPIPPPAPPEPPRALAPPAQRMSTHTPARPADARTLRKRARELQQEYDGLYHQGGLKFRPEMHRGRTSRTRSRTLRSRRRVRARARASTRIAMCSGANTGISTDADT